MKPCGDPPHDPACPVQSLRIANAAPLRERGEYVVDWRVSARRTSDSFPLKTLQDPAGDPGPHLHARADFEEAQIHDPLWNAAQRQLVTEGRMHNYLRMLWG